MPNITRDMSLKWVQIEHPVLGALFINEHLINITSEPMSDTEEVTEPGAGGGRVRKKKRDTARKITIEVNGGSFEEGQLRRMILFDAEFSLQWQDAQVLINTQGGTALECTIKDTANDRGADTITFEIWSMRYSGN